MSRLLIGLPALKGKLDNYAKRFGMVEVTPVDTSLPKPSKLAAWREKVPPAFAFSVVLPKAVAALTPGKALEAALAESLEVATALQAECIVLATAPTIRPTPRNRERITELAKRLPTAGQALVWHATGLWEPEDYMATARAGGWLPVFDAAQQPLPPGPVVYTRIRSIGHASELGHQRIAIAARSLANRRTAYVVVDERIAGKVKTGLEHAIAGLDVPRAVPLLFKPSSGDDSDLGEEQ